MAANCLTDKKYWQGQMSGFKPFEVTGHDLESLLLHYLPADAGMSCVEIGAYPGASLCYLAKKFGYKPTAIEYRDDAADIGRLFEHNGIADLEIINDDFLGLKGLQFDVVTSFGFVEHFADYRKMIALHVEMMKPGGYLVLAVPYLGGLQGVLRKLLLTPEALAELYRTHNRQVMSLSEMEGNLERLGLTLLYGDFVMGGRFWVAPDSPRIRPGLRWLAQAVALLDRVVLGKIPSSFLYSPMIVCIARKP